MNGLLKARWPWLGCRGLAAFVLFPALASAASWLGFRNELTTDVVVRDAPVINNVVGAPQVRQLYRGEVAVESILLPHFRQVTVTSPRDPNRILYQGRIACTENLFFSIRRDKSGRVTLIRTDFPTRPPQ